jgi:hypothetical protein
MSSGVVKAVTREVLMTYTVKPCCHRKSRKIDQFRCGRESVKDPVVIVWRKNSVKHRSVRRACQS